MRACIYGAGAMGTVLGAYISRAGRQIDLVTRNLEHVRALNACGADITFARGGGFNAKVKALLPEQMQGQYDIIFLMTKQRDNAQIVAFLQQFLADDGVICTTQNGLPEYSVAQTVGENRCLGCAVSWGASYISPGKVMLTSSPDALTFSLGSPFAGNEKQGDVAALLGCMGKVEEEENFLGARWSKLIVNSAFSTLSAITSLTFGQIAKVFKTRAIAQTMLKEGMDVASANGVAPAPIQGHDLVRWLNYSNPFKKALSFLIIPIAMKKHSALVSGMYYDLIAGRKCDAPFVAGVVSRFAEKAGSKVPYTDKALEIVAMIEEGRAVPCAENLKLFARL